LGILEKSTHTKPNPRTVAAMEEKKAMKKSALYASRTLAYWAK
jgi:hypothetical protein